MKTQLNKQLNLESGQFTRTLSNSGAWSRCVLIVLLCSTIIGCTNSKLVLRPLYNSVDNRFEEPLLAHANFDPSQVSEIKDLIDHFHVWHRQTQLPEYAALMDSVVASQRSNELVTADQVEVWADELYSFQTNFIQCNPAYSSAAIVTSLSDQQIEEIRSHRLERREQRRIAREKRIAAEDFEFDSDEDDADVDEDRRIARTKRYLGFIGLDLNAAQLEDLRATMNSTIRPETRFSELREELDEALYARLDARKKPNWQAALNEFIEWRRDRILDWRKVSRDHNREVWKAYAVRAFQSLESDQKKALAKYLSGLSATVKSLAADEPSFKKRTSEQFFCAT